MANEISLKEYIEMKFIELGKRVDLTFELHKIALDKAEIKSDLVIKNMKEKVDELQININKRPAWITSVIIGVFTFVLGILGAILVKGI
jgi:hypothetical protein